MLTTELASLFRNIVALPQRDDQRLCQVPRIGLRALPWSVLLVKLLCTMTLGLTRQALTQHSDSSPGEHSLFVR